MCVWGGGVEKYRTFILQKGEKLILVEFVECESDTLGALLAELFAYRSRAESI